MPPNTIFLRLEGPLQSWGERSRWSIRDTSTEPTKSGIIGLVACALGYSDDEQIRPLSQKTRLGIRVDSPGTQIVDYHTIGGGYDYPTLLTAQGKPKKNPTGTPHTELSERAYLCDASFLAALQVRDPADISLIPQMAQALQNPTWPIYLGRKACVPSLPVFAGTAYHATLLEALKAHTTFTQYARYRSQEPVRLRFILESDEPVGRRQRDNIYSRRYRIYHPRYVTTPQPDELPTYRVEEDEGNVSVQIAT